MSPEQVESTTGMRDGRKYRRKSSQREAIVGNVLHKLSMVGEEHKLAVLQIILI